MDKDVEVLTEKINGLEKLIYLQKKGIHQMKDVELEKKMDLIQEQINLLKMKYRKLYE